MSHLPGQGSPPVTWPIPAPQRVLVAGDWHGNERAAENAFIAAAEHDATMVVQLGDFGLWPGDSGRRYLEAIERITRIYELPLAWIDGNHEDFDQLETYPVNPASGLRPMGDLFWHIPRASRWTWHGHVWAALGGATSLDRPHRTPGHSWWPQEAITGGERQALEAGGTVDVLLTHDCPSVVHIPGIRHRDPLPSRVWPQAELEIAWEHRDLMADTVTVVQPGLILHGHFHVFHDQTVILPDTPDGTPGRACRIVGLADDSTPAGNRVLVDTETLTLQQVH